MYVRVLGDDGPLKITTYHVTWLSSGNKALLTLLSSFLEQASMNVCVLCVCACVCACVRACVRACECVCTYITAS